MFPKTKFLSNMLGFKLIWIEEDSSLMSTSRNKRKRKMMRLSYKEILECKFRLTFQKTKHTTKPIQMKK